MAQENAWVRFTCSTDRRARVATFRHSGAEWQLVSVSRQPSSGVEFGSPPRVDSTPDGPVPTGTLGVNGPFGIAPDYRGCPGCGNDSYVRCGSCGELGCWRSSKPHFTCGACGNGGEVSGSIQSINALDVG